MATAVQNEGATSPTGAAPAGPIARGKSAADAAEGDLCRQVVASAAQAIVAVDRDLRITVWNQAAREVFGRTPEEMLGTTPALLVADGQWPRLERLLLRSLEEQVVTAFEERRTGPYGGEMCLAVVLSPLLDEAGNSTGVVGLVRDITQRKRLESDLGNAEKLAALGRLAGGVAHHFNNLLAGMSTRIDFALQGRDPRKMEKALQVASDSAARMAEIVRNLLIFARPFESRLEPAELSAVVGEFAALKRGALAGRRVEVETLLQPAGPVMMNREHFDRLLLNLADNAVEALGGKPGRIRLRTWQEDGHAKLEFADDGPGVEPQAAPHMFEPFFSTKGAFSGSAGNHVGLGLAVAHAVAGEMGGRIEMIPPPVNPASQATPSGKFQLPPRGLAGVDMAPQLAGPAGTGTTGPGSSAGMGSAPPSGSVSTSTTVTTSDAGARPATVSDPSRRGAVFVLTVPVRRE